MSCLYDYPPGPPPIIGSRCDARASVVGRGQAGAESGRLSGLRPLFFGRRGSAVLPCAPAWSTVPAVPRTPPTRSPLHLPCPLQYLLELLSGERSEADPHEVCGLQPPAMCQLPQPSPPSPPRPAVLPFRTWFAPLPVDGHSGARCLWPLVPERVFVCSRGTKW